MIVLKRTDCEWSFTHKYDRAELANNHDFAYAIIVLVEQRFWNVLFLVNVEI